MAAVTPRCACCASSARQEPALPLALLLTAQFTVLATAPATVLAVAALLQYLGLLAERWLFFAEANHPQNLYYQRMA